MMEKLSRKEESVNNMESGQEKHEVEVPEKDGRDIVQAAEETGTPQVEENGSNSGSDVVNFINFFHCSHSIRNCLILILIL